jgi:hypothetical protein
MKHTHIQNRQLSAPFKPKSSQRAIQVRRDDDPSHIAHNASWIRVALTSVLLMCSAQACAGGAGTDSTAATSTTDESIIADASGNPEVQRYSTLLVANGWQVPSVPDAKIEHYRAPAQSDAKATTGDVAWSRAAFHLVKGNERAELFFARSNGDTPVVILSPTSPGAAKELQAVLSEYDGAAGASATPESTAQDTATASSDPEAADSDVESVAHTEAAVTCGNENGACPCCTGYYCGYNYSSSLHCYCQRSRWSCSYTKYVYSGNGACRTDENPGGIYHVVLTRRGCQNGSGMYADWRGAGVICPQPQIGNTGSVPVCGRP